MRPPSTPAPSLNLGYGPATLNRQALVYTWLVALSATTLVVANMIGVRLFSYGLPFSYSLPWDPKTTITSIDHTCGLILFPLTFLITDLLNEYFGKKAARRAVVISFAMALVTFLAIKGADAMPRLDQAWNIPEAAFDAIFTSAAAVMFFASMMAYFIGNICDIAMFAWIKRMTGGKLIWLRATGSTVGSQLIDSFVVCYLAFKLGREMFPDPNLVPITWAEVIKFGLTSYMLKFVIAVSLTPLIYAGRAFIKRVWGLQPLPPE